MIGASPKTGLKMFRDQDQPKLPGFMAVADFLSMDMWGWVETSHLQATKMLWKPFFISWRIDPHAHLTGFGRYFECSPPWNINLTLYLASSLTFFLAFYFTYVLTFYLTFFPVFYLTYALRFYLTHILTVWHSLWHMSQSRRAKSP